MKILHTSDLHLGLILSEQSMLDDQKFMIDSLIEIAVREKVGAVIVAGDVFDRQNAPNEAYELFDEMTEKLCLVNEIPVFICAGNHDSPSKIKTHEKMLSKSGLHIKGKLDDNLVPIIIEDCAFYSIPYFNIETARFFFGNEIKSYQDAYLIICQKLKECKEKTKINILISHCFVTGGVLTDSDKSAKLGGATMISADVFDGFDYTALGHLHTAQSVGKNVRYSGTPLKYSFAEHSLEKSVAIFDSETKETKLVKIPAKRDVRLLKGGYIELLLAAEKESGCEDYIKIVLEDRFPTAEFLEIFKHHYPNLLGLEGMSYSSEATISSLTASEVSRMSPVEILKSYFSGDSEHELGEFELEWFDKALAAVQKKEEQK